MAIFSLSSPDFFFFFGLVTTFQSFRFRRFDGFACFGCFISVVSFRCFGFLAGYYQFRSVSFSARVNFKFDSLHHICVFMSNLHLMCFDICIYATDLYLKALTEKYGDKNCVDFMQIRQFIEHIHMFIYTCQACAQCFFLCVFCLYMML